MDALPIADEVFLVGHDENSGKPHISDGTMDTVLAGAVLGELVIAGRLGVNEATLVVVHEWAPADDEVCDAAFAEIVKQTEQYPVRAWAEHLRASVRPMVAARLERRGLIERVESRVMLKTTVRYPFRQRFAAAAPVARMRYMLDHPQNLDEPTALLAGLIVASSLESVFGGANPRHIRAQLSGMAELLRPELRLLIAGIDSAVAALVLSGRR